MFIKVCDVCKKSVDRNIKYCLTKHGLDMPPPPGIVQGYITPPIIDGIIVTSVSGNGKNLHFCDVCVGKLLDLLNIEKVEEE